MVMQPPQVLEHEEDIKNIEEEGGKLHSDDNIADVFTMFKELIAGEKGRKESDEVEDNTEVQGNMEYNPQTTKLLTYTFQNLQPKYLKLDKKI